MADKNIEDFLDSDGITEEGFLDDTDFAKDIPNVPSPGRIGRMGDEIDEVLDEELEPTLVWLGLGPDRTPDETYGNPNYMYEEEIDPKSGKKKQYVLYTVPDGVRPGHEINTGIDSEDDEERNLMDTIDDHKNGFFTLFDLDSPYSEEHKNRRKLHQMSFESSKSPFSLKDALTSRYAEAVRRASKEAMNEQSNSNDPRRHGAVLRYAPEADNYHILNTFDISARLRDGQRGMKFLKSRPGIMNSLSKISQKAFAHKRGQYGFYVKDIFNRLQAEDDFPSAASRINPDMSSFQQISLKLPVYSSVEWKFEGLKGSGLYKNEQKNIDKLLSEKLGLKNAFDQTAAKLDAIHFFRDHFGVDTSNFDEMTKDDVTLIPYSVTKHVSSRVTQAEGHLGSWFVSKKLGNLGNGRVFYHNKETENKDGSRFRTTPGKVTEIGWMLRTSNPDGLQLSENRILNKGDQLVSGYWIIERPGAIPSLMHFQSAEPSKTIATRFASGAVGKFTTMNLDIYDMLHNIEKDPTRAVGRAQTIISQKLFKADPHHQQQHKSNASMHTILAMRH